MSITALKWAFEREVNSTAKFVLVALANFADEGGYCYPKQETLSRLTGQHLRTVQRGLQQLEEAGLIRHAARWTAKGNRRADCYWLVMGDEPPEEFAPYLPPDDGPQNPPPPEGEDEGFGRGDKAAESQVIRRQRVALYKAAESQVIHKGYNRHSSFEPSLFEPP